jgi:hypothetical protein
MHYQELHQRYGSSIANRVKTELHNSEFLQINLEELLPYLELRAEAAHKEYQIQLADRYSDGKISKHASLVDALHRRWKEAEELAYLLLVAEDVNTNARLAAV